MRQRRVLGEASIGEIARLLRQFSSGQGECRAGKPDASRPPCEGTANDATLAEDIERDFVRALEVLNTHGARFEKWIERNLGELNATKEKKTAAHAVPNRDASTKSVLSDEDL